MDIAVGAASELGFELRDAATGGASDANTTSSAGTPTIDGLGPIGGDDHGPAEWVDLTSVVPRVALLAAIVSGREPMTIRPHAELHPDAYRALVEGAPAILYIDRPDELSTNLYTSPQVVELLGYTVEEWTRDAELWGRALHPDDRDRVVDEHRISNVRGERFLCEYRILARDGRRRGSATKRCRSRPTRAPSCTGAG